MLPEMKRTDPTRLLLTTDSVGGVWTYSRDMGMALADRNFTVTLAVIGPSASPEARAACEDAGLDLIDLGGTLDWTATSDAELEPVRRRILEAAGACQADLVQVHAPAFVPEHRTCPVVSVAHSCIATWWARVRGGDLPPSLAWHADATARGLANADAIVAPSHAFATDLKEVYDLGRTIHVIHNGRPLPHLAPNGTPRDAVFATGRVWDEAKNLALLDRIAPALDCPVEIAGATRSPDGSVRAPIHARALGHASEEAIRARLAERPIFVSAAFYEPFGLGVLEAAQAGCALVLADQPTFRELWDGCALFADPRDDDAFANRIRVLLHDPVTRGDLGRAARRRAAEYSIEASANALSQLLDSISRARVDCLA